MKAVGIVETRDRRIITRLSSFTYSCRPKVRRGPVHDNSVTVTIIPVKAFNHSGLQSASQLLTNETEDIDPVT